MSERPRRNDPRAVLAAAKALLPDVKEWLRGDQAQPNDEGTLADLTKAMLYDRDAYQIARNLERQFWSPDGELVEILNSAYRALDDAENDLVKEWVESQGVTVPFYVGQIVEFFSGAKQRTGTITAIQADVAKCVVAPPDDPKFKAGGGYVVPAEACTPVQS